MSFMRILRRSPWLVLPVMIFGGVAPASPNILFILADDLGWGDPSCYGNTRFKTPAVDRLAREGTLFTQFYQTGSVCSPSRASLLTGRWPAELRLHGHLAAPEENRKRDMAQFLDPSVPYPSPAPESGRLHHAPRRQVAPR